MSHARLRLRTHSTRPRPNRTHLLYLNGVRVSRCPAVRRPKGMLPRAGIISTLRTVRQSLVVALNGSLLPSPIWHRLRTTPRAYRPPLPFAAPARARAESLRRHPYHCQKKLSRVCSPRGGATRIRSRPDPKYGEAAGQRARLAPRSSHPVAHHEKKMPALCVALTSCPSWAARSPHPPRRPRRCCRRPRRRRPGRGPRQEPGSPCAWPGRQSCPCRPGRAS